MFLLSLLWVWILFDSGASHSFIAASCVKELGLEVETLENSLHVSSSLGTRVRVDMICRGSVRDPRDSTHGGPSGYGHVRV